VEQIIEFEDWFPPPPPSRDDGSGPYSRAFIGPAWRYAFRPRPDARKIRSSSQDLLARPGIESALRTLWEEGEAGFLKLFDADNNQITNPSFERVFDAFVGSLLEVVYDYLDEWQSYELDPERFVQSYLQRRVWDEVEVHYAVTVPLLGFQTESWPVDLSGLVQVDVLTANEKTELWNNGSLQRYIDFDTFMWCSFVLRQEYHRKLSDGINHQALQARHHSNLALTALRLLHAGHVIATASSTRSVSPPTRGANAGGLEDLGGSFHSHDSYYLEASEIPALREIFAKLIHMEASGTHRQLGLALRRFNSTYSRRKREDQIIDLTIALESCLLVGVEQELKYRLALRGAVLLSHPRKPEETASLLRVVYDVRSAIVHEGLSLEEMAVSKTYKKLFNNIPHNVIVDKARECVRQVVRVLIENLEAGRSLRSVNTDLDSAIVRSLNPSRNEKVEGGNPVSH